MGGSTSFRVRSILGALLAGALAFATISVGTANAVDSGDTATTFTVTGGLLEISVPVTAILGTGAPGSNITAQMGAVAITDGRALLDPFWAVTVTSTNFVGAAAVGPQTIAAELVDYWSGPILTAAPTPTSGFTFTASQPLVGNAVPFDTNTTPTATPSFALLIADTGVGINTAGINPTLIVHVPAQQVADTYAGTVTHSVAP